MKYDSPTLNSSTKIRANQKNDINAFAHARDRVLKVDATGTVYQHTLENVDLFEPGVELRLFERAGMSARQFANYFV